VRNAIQENDFTKLVATKALETRNDPKSPGKSLPRPTQLMPRDPVREGLSSGTTYGSHRPIATHTEELHRLETTLPSFLVKG
jgi:hypothetical protein